MEEPSSVRINGVFATRIVEDSKSKDADVSELNDKLCGEASVSIVECRDFGRDIANAHSDVGF